MLWSLAIGVMLFCVGLAGVLFAFKWRGRSRGLGMPDTATVDGTTLLFGETAEHEDRTSTAPPRSQGAVTDGGSERGS